MRTQPSTPPGYRFVRPYSDTWASQVALVAKNPPVNAGDIKDVGQSLGWEDPLKEGMATHSSVLAWRLPWTEEPDGLQSTVLHRIEHDCRDLASVHAHR